MNTPPYRPNPTEDSSLSTTEASSCTPHAEPVHADTPLRQSEQEVLAECEEDILESYTWWILRVLALASIRDFRLYRSTHVSFEAYAEDVWKMGPHEVHELLELADLAEAIRDDGPWPLSEAHVRPLVGLDVDRALKLWWFVTEAAGGPSHVTVELVAKAVDMFSDKE